MLTGIKARAAVAGPIGILSLFLTAISAFVQLDSSFARIWNISSNRSRVGCGLK
jgi:uncharacterized BrkB/YihY/UPF0761 family membrane protein